MMCRSYSGSARTRSLGQATIIIALAFVAILSVVALSVNTAMAQKVHNQETQIAEAAKASILARSYEIKYAENPQKSIAHIAATTCRNNGLEGMCDVWVYEIEPPSSGDRLIGVYMEIYRDVAPAMPFIGFAQKHVRPYAQVAFTINPYDGNGDVYSPATKPWLSGANGVYSYSFDGSGKMPVPKVESYSDISQTPSQLQNAVNRGLEDIS